VLRWVGSLEADVLCPSKLEFSALEKISLELLILASLSGSLSAVDEPDVPKASAG
jgi:hypothetical protein